jgi:RND family efflux transporter MFP subunit
MGSKLSFEMSKDQNKEKIEQTGVIGERLNENRLNRGKNKVWKRLGMGAGGVLAVLIGYWLVAGQGANAQYELIKVARGDLRESVEITGNVEAGATINLSFRESGQIGAINYEVSDSLKKGDIIASLKNNEKNIGLEKAQNSLNAANANLNERLAGSTAQDIRIAEVNVDAANAAAGKILVDFENAKEEIDLIRTKYQEDEKKAQLMVDDALTKLNFAKTNQTNTSNVDAQTIENARQSLQTEILSISSTIQQNLINLKSIIVDDGNSALGIDFDRLDNNKLNIAQKNYFEVKNWFDPFYQTIKMRVDTAATVLKADADNLEKYVSLLLEAQKLTSDMLSVMAASSSLPQTKITELKNLMLNDSSVLTSALAALNRALQALINAELGIVSSGDSSLSDVQIAENFYNQQLQNLASLKIDNQVDLNKRQTNIESLQAQYQVQLADIEAKKASLEKAKAGPRAVDTAFLRTQVAAANLEVSLAREALERTLLRAPLDGILSRKNIEVGEDTSLVISTGGDVREPMFEMISDQKFKIEASIAEVDIGKIRVGDKAEIKIDAIGAEVTFPGQVVKIDPVQTVIQDVVFYKAEVLIDSEDDRIKPGMTANVEIVVKENSGVLMIPEKAVLRENGKKYVRIPDGEELKMVEVETGIRNLDGEVEVLSGLKEGDEIVLRTTTAQ